MTRSKIPWRTYTDAVLVMPVASMVELEGVLLIAVDVKANSTSSTEVKELMLVELLIVCVTTEV